MQSQGGADSIFINCPFDSHIDNVKHLHMQEIILKPGSRKLKLSKSKLRKAIEKAYADILTPEIRKIKDPAKRTNAMYKQMLKIEKAKNKT